MPTIRIPARVPRSGKSVKGTNKRPRKGPKVVPNKTPPAPQNRRDSSSSLSSPANLSDENGYSALEDASDSEDDDEDHVDAAEAEHILSRERQAAATSSPRSNSDYEEDEAADADDDDSGDDEEEMVDHERQPMFNDHSSSYSGSWNGLSPDGDEQAPYPVDFFGMPGEQSGPPVERHVRFAGVPESDADTDETDEHNGDFDDFFPDIFISQEDLDRTFRREIEQDDGMDSDASSSYWDHNGLLPNFAEDLSGPEDEQNLVDLPTAVDVHEHDHSNMAANGASATLPSGQLEGEEDDESDGYETDGETTEEDEPVSAPSTTPIPNPLFDFPEMPNLSALSFHKKPISVVNPHTRKMMIFTRRIKRISQPSPAQLPDGFGFLSQAPNAGFSLTPQISQTSGIPWPADSPLAFAILPPFSQINIHDPAFTLPLLLGPASESSSLPAEEEASSGKEFEFVDLGHCASDENNTDGVDTPSRRPSDAVSSASDNNPTSSMFNNNLFEHFDKCPDAVGAFRKNQTNQKLLSTGVATQESLAFNNPLYEGALRGIKNGSLEGAATPLTPERRHKKAFAKSRAETTTTKRKASGTASDNTDAHKKQRSF